MKFVCEKYLLQSACATASRAAASKSPIPALEGLLIEAGADVKVTGYNLREGIYTKLGANVAEPGSVIIGARFLGELLRRLPDGNLTMTADEGNKIKVKCGRSEFNFVGIAVEDYPEMPDVDGLNHITLPQKILRSMINQTLFAVGRHADRRGGGRLSSGQAHGTAGRGPDGKLQLCGSRLRSVGYRKDLR